MVDKKLEQKLQQRKLLERLPWNEIAGPISQIALWPWNDFFETKLLARFLRLHYGPREITIGTNAGRGLDVLQATKLLKGTVREVYMANPWNTHFKQYKDRADDLMCATLPGLPSTRLKLTPGGLIHTRPGSNFQYVTTTALLLTIYSQYLRKHSRNLVCDKIVIPPRRLTEFAQQQVDYILGVNPSNMSYMVGFGSNYPKQVHHRAASIPSDIQSSRS